MDRRLLKFWLVLSLCVCGCGKAKPPLPAASPVRGQISYANGDPIALGVIQFASEENPSLNISGTVKDGKFEIKTAYGNEVLPGVMPGTYRVTAVPAFESTPVTFEVADVIKIGVQPVELSLRCKPLKSGKPK